jgi:hypothetical protein
MIPPLWHPLGFQVPFHLPICGRIISGAGKDRKQIWTILVQFLWIHKKYRFKTPISRLEAGVPAMQDAFPFRCTRGRLSPDLKVQDFL